MKKLALLIAMTLAPLVGLHAQTIAPDGPGKDAQWATAGKQAVGTAANTESKVWFTLAQGAMTEVYYPDVTVANVHLLQFVVVNRRTKKVETERNDARSSVKSLPLAYSKTLFPELVVTIRKNFSSPSSMVFEQTTRGENWWIRKTYLADPDNNTVLFTVDFTTRSKDLDLYVYFDPSIGNSGMGDTGWDEGRTLFATDGKIAAALTCGRCRLSDPVSGFLGVNDGLTQLRSNGKITNPYHRAENGNIVLTAKVTPVSLGNAQPMVFSLGLGDSPETALASSAQSLSTGFDRVKAKYQLGWYKFLAELPDVEASYKPQFNMAAMVLHAHEDKTVRGANIASLTVPWGGGDNANANNIGGYHLIWSRDLYQVATAYMALGDRKAALRALDFLLKIQQKPDGSFPQNSFLDGKPFWGSLQLDEVAYPIILAHELGVFDKETYERHLKKAADFIVRNGPATPQERWEEESGYSPSTIAAEIAGLVCAGEIAAKNGDKAAAERYFKTADEWAANVEKWTVTRTGPYSKLPYYVRITANGRPDAGEKIELNNGAGFFDERAIVDAGFLELVRLGIKRADDPIIENSVKVIDEVIRVKTPNGDGFYRYNHDGYGEMDDGRRWNWDGKYTGKGRLWALLSGERGQYELALALGNPNSGNPDPEVRLNAMRAFANEGLMIPEQVWDRQETPKGADRQFVPELRFGEGTGSATPLAWSMAQFIRLAVNLKEGRNLDTPRVVYERYAARQTISAIALSDTASVNACLAEITAAKGQRPDAIVGASRSPLIGRCDGRDVAVFIHRGRTASVELAGDFTGWQPGNIRLAAVGATEDVKAAIVPFAASARIEYKLIVDGNWILDPLNPNRIDNGVGGQNSVFEMPGYTPSPWAANDSRSRPERCEPLEVDSKIYTKPKICVMAPRSRTPLPVLYLQDGSEYRDRANAFLVMQRLVAAKRIKPFIMVFLDPKDRMKEYWASNDYAKFVAEEVVLAVDLKYRTIRSPDSRAIMGASLGGITSVYVGLKYPKVFRRVGGQSVSWWVDDERVVKLIGQTDGKTPYRFYIDDGALEGVEDSRRSVELLRRRGYAVKYLEGEAGHNWTAWRDRLADGFVALMN